MHYALYESLCSVQCTTLYNTVHVYVVVTAQNSKEEEEKRPLAAHLASDISARINRPTNRPTTFRQLSEDGFGILLFESQHMIRFSGRRVEL